MQEISNTLQVIMDIWQDPGDYPSGAGGCALRDQKYVADVCGSVTVALEDEDLIALIGDYYEPELINARVIAWQIVKVEGRKVTFRAKDFVTEDN